MPPAGFFSMEVDRLPTENQSWCRPLRAFSPKGYTIDRRNVIVKMLSSVETSVTAET
ncbi:hypothetical protein ALCH109712_03615 [Alkalicoccus chagannorensis]